MKSVPVMIQILSTDRMSADSYSCHNVIAVYGQPE